MSNYFLGLGRLVGLVVPLGLPQPQPYCEIFFTICYILES